MEHVGKNIKMLRKQKGWNQRQVADQLEVSVPAFSKMECGITDLNFSRVDQIATLFGITPTELLAEGMGDAFTPSLGRVDQLKALLAIKEDEIIRLQNKIIQLYEQAQTDKVKDE
jgi:transcriptional regulator with XRE-family HTH domain